jgi:ATP-dependent helicase/DNAse subunit B
VSLTLVTGPANAEKARVVLDGYRKALARGEAPVLVVPTLADVDRYRSELAEGGLVFGTHVARFEWLIDEAARRAGVPGRPLAGLARRRVAAAAVADTSLSALAASAATAGFVGALLALVDELEQRRVTPQRLTHALRAWAEEDERRRAYADEVCALYSAYRRRLERLRRSDRPLYAVAALDALREQPAAWGATPVFIYGFDDLTPIEADAVQTLAQIGARVTLSLAYEPGRLAFSGRATTFAELYGPEVEHVALTAREEHYAPAARRALHHLERGLFELEQGTLFDPDPVDPGAAVTLLRGGGERAELELVAAEAARLIGEQHVPAEEIAVVVRDPGAIARLLAEVFEGAGVPVALQRHVAFGHTALGRGLLALLRCALLDGSADDLVAWLRTPGLLRLPALADDLEALARQTGARSADAARALWEAEHWPLQAIDRVRDAQGRGGAALLRRCSAELVGLFSAPRRRAAEVLAGPDVQDGAVLAAGRAALEQLAALAAADATLAPQPRELAQLLGDLDVRCGGRPARGSVTVTDPLSLRARRVRALFACGLQEGAFPRLPRAAPFFGDAERDQIAAASGLRLGRRDELGAERYLFYATVSRPEERLYLSWHEADDEGERAVRSFFVSDVCDLFGGELERRARTRSLGQVGWLQGVAPSERARLRERAAAGPRRREPVIGALTDPALLAGLRERASWSASGIELWAGCPVKWFVERLLKPAGLLPDPELMLRGALAHLLLETTLRGLAERTGSARLTPATLPLAQQLAAAALDGLEHDARLTMSRDLSRQRALAHRLRSDLLRYLEHAATDGSQLEPAELELAFGGPADERDTLQLGDEVRLRGRIDRIDVGPDGRAIVYDYKGRVAVESASWREKRKFQVALYMLVARDVLGLDPIGGLYQPLGGSDQRPRGLLIEDAEPGLRSVATDRRPRAAFDAVLDGVLGDVRCAVAELRAGALGPRPESCAYNGGGCQYPTICRCEAA